MKRQLLAIALVAGFAASAWPQTRVETAAPESVPGAILAAPAPGRISPIPVPPDQLSPGALPPSASVSVSPAVLAAPVAAAAPAQALPAAPAAAKFDPAAPPRAWDLTRWRESLPTEDASSWKFRDPWVASARLWDGWRRARPVGAGVMGAVFVHPWDSDRVVKVARRGYKDYAGEYFARDDEEVLSSEDFALARLAGIGAAPRPLARLTVSGRPASVRERVWGFTVAELKRRGAYGERERGLVHEMLDRIADAGFVATDLNLGNIVIGRIDSKERAWLVDTLGVTVRGDIDAAGRKQRMLAEPIPWIAFRGAGIGRRLGDALEVGKRLGYEREPLAWPRWKRWTTLAGLLGALAVVPALAHAAMSSPLSLGVLPSWPVLAVVAAFIGLAGIPVRIFAHRLAPWVMTRGKDAGDEMLRHGPLSAAGELAIAAAIEELFFRAGLFMAGAFVLHSFLPLVPAIAAASFLSSMIFALIHGYGSVWTRVVGGMLYAGAFVASGSLLLPIAAHFVFNLSLYVYGRYLR